MELVLEAIQDFPKDIDAEEAMNRITNRIHSFYVKHNLLADLEEQPGKRFTANGVIYSYARNEVWQVGDCQCIVGNLYSSNEKPIDAIMANARSVVNEVALLNGMTMEDFEKKTRGVHSYIHSFSSKRCYRIIRRKDSFIHSQYLMDFLFRWSKLKYSKLVMTEKLSYLQMDIHIYFLR